MSRRGRCPCGNPFETTSVTRKYCSPRCRSRARGGTPQASTVARGYGPDHRRLREHWRPIVASGGVVCGRCGRLIVPGTPWDLGHTEDRTAYTGPEHMGCNRSEGATRGNLRRRGRWVAKARTSRVW